MSHVLWHYCELQSIQSVNSLMQTFTSTSIWTESGRWTPTLSSSGAGNVPPAPSTAAFLQPLTHLICSGVSPPAFRFGLQHWQIVAGLGFEPERHAGIVLRHHLVEETLGPDWKALSAFVAVNAPATSAVVFGVSPQAQLSHDAVESLPDVVLHGRRGLDELAVKHHGRSTGLWENNKIIHSKTFRWLWTCRNHNHTNVDVSYLVDEQKLSSVKIVTLALQSHVWLWLSILPFWCLQHVFWPPYLSQSTHHASKEQSVMHLFPRCFNSTAWGKRHTLCFLSCVQTHYAFVIDHMVYTWKKSF